MTREQKSLPENNREPAASGQPGGFRQRIPAEAAVWIFILVSGLILARGFLFQPGSLMSGDNPMHQAEITALREIVLGEQGWWSGWYEGDFAGYPLLVYQYPIGKWLVVLLSAIPGIGLSLAYKALLWFSWLLPVLVLVRILARRGHSLLVLSVASLLYLTCFDSFLLSLAGMWNQYLSAGLFLVSLDMMLRLLDREGAWSLSRAAIWSSLAAVSHQFMLFLLPIAWLVVIGISLTRAERSSKVIRNLLLLPVIAFLMSSWYFLPVFMTINWPSFVAYPMEWYSVRSSLFPIVFSDLLRPQHVFTWADPLILRYSLGMVVAMLLGLAGMVKLFLPSGRVRNRDPLLLASAGLFLSVAALIFLVLWEPLPALRSFSLSVGGGRLSLYLLLPLVFLSTAILEFRPRQRGASKATLLFSWLMPVILLPNLFWGMKGEEFPLPELQYLETLEDSGEHLSQETDALLEVFSWLAENASQAEGRILYQDTAYNFRGHNLFWSHIMSLGREQTGLWSIGGSGQLFVPTDPVTRTQGRFLFGRDRDRITEAEIRKGMRLFNCRWALACEPELRALLSGCEFMNPVLDRGEFTLFRNTDVGGWAEILKGEGRVEVAAQKDGSRLLDARIDSDTGAQVLVKSSYHPWWKIMVNGKAVEAETDPSDNLLRFSIPPGEESCRIEMEFSPPRLLPALLTLLGFGLAGVLCFIPENQSNS